MQAVAREYRSTLAVGNHVVLIVVKREGTTSISYYVSVVSCKNAMVITLKYITGLTS